MFGPMQVVASHFLNTLKEYPPSQLPGDWSLETLEKQIEDMNKPAL
jgi:arylsulfatase